jgi:twitching motility protein PilT
MPSQPEPAEAPPAPTALYEPAPGAVSLHAAPESRPAVVLPLTRPTTRVESLIDAAGARPPLDRLLRLAAGRGASGLYIVSESRPAIRVDGEIRILEAEPPLGASDVAAMLMELAPERTRDALRSGAQAEWVRDVAGVGRVRCLSFREHRGPGGIFRMLPARALSVERLGLSPTIQSLCNETEGLVLVTGPHASGKSTLVSGLVDLINNTRADHVITLESQILFLHESRRSFVSQRELRGTRDELAAAARAALREDPDVLVIEDLRSPELISSALEAAETGHLVFGAVSAAGATAALERVVDQFPADRRAQVQTALGDTLRAVVGQVLLRKVGGGRIPAREVLINTRPVAALLAEGRTSELAPAMESGRRLGCVPLNDALLAAVRSGTVDPIEAYRKAYDREGLLALLRREQLDTSFVERLA